MGLLTLKPSLFCKKTDIWHMGPLSLKRLFLTCSLSCPEAPPVCSCMPLTAPPSPLLRPCYDPQHKVSNGPSASLTFRPPRVQVADALADTGLPSWIDMLARRTLATSRATPASRAQTLGALLPLRPELLHRVFTSCLTHATLDTLLQACHPVLHPHILSAAGASGIIVAGNNTLDALLAALPHTQFPAGIALRYFRLSRRPAEFSHSTPALLAHAVSSHRGLTTLILSPSVITPAALRHFRTGLGHGALATVSQFAVCVAAQPESCVELARCLASLPAVATLTVHFCSTEQQPAAAGGELAPFVRAAAAPAVLMQLRHLTLGEGGVQPKSSSFCDLFLPLLEAPTLSSLKVSSAATAGSYDALLKPMPHLSTIQDLHIDADLWPPAPAGAPGGALPALTGLRLSSVYATVPLCAATAAIPHARGTLRSLSLEHVCKTQTRAAAAARRDEAAAFAAFFEALRSCTALQSLNLGQLTSVSVLSGQVTWSDGLTATLAHLTQLTHLRMRPPCTGCEARSTCSCVLEGAALADALRRLTALQVLEVCGGAGCTGSLPMKAPERVLAAVADLRQLRSLGLCFWDFQWCEVQRLVAGLPALKVLEVTPETIGERDEGDKGLRAGVEVRCHACSAEAKPLRVM